MHRVSQIVFKLIKNLGCDLRVFLKKKLTVAKRSIGREKSSYKYY